MESKWHSTSTGSNKVPRKTRKLTIAQKLEVLDMHDKGERISRISCATGLCDSTLRTILKNAERIRASAILGGPLSSLRRTLHVRPDRIVRMEELLARWVERHNENGIPLQANMIREKASTLYEELKEHGVKGSRPFSASSGWLVNFKKRHGFHSFNITRDRKAEVETSKIGVCHEGFLPLKDCQESTMKVKSDVSQERISQDYSHHSVAQEICLDIAMRRDCSNCKQGESTATCLPSIPDYIFAEKLGSGNHAEVYKAYRKGQVREVVAVKCVLQASLSKSALNNLESEIKILKRLNHEHIVQMLDFVWDERYVYIIMEYCSGGDLSAFVRSRQRLPESVCQRFLQQLAAALQYMREQNVSHLDLKPSNILLKSRKNQVLKIGDFGLAQLMPEDDTNNTVKGSPLYMAPEIVLKHHYDAKVDLWSVGVILYECLFGKAPYSSKSMDELVLKIKRDKPIEVPCGTNISPACRDLLLRCLERDVAKRIDFDAFFSHPFVDLEHKPGPDSMTKATNLLTRAINFDECREYEQAYRNYCEALQYLVPLLHSEGDASKRVALRRKVTEYLSRTEELKKGFSSDSDVVKSVSVPSIPSVPQQDSANSLKLSEYKGNREELLRLTATTPQIQAAIEIGASGELYAREGNYAIAFEKYQLALGKLLELMQGEPKGRRKDLLREEMTRWMSQAEHLKEILRDTPTQESPTSEMFSSVAEEKKECVVQ